MRRNVKISSKHLRVGWWGRPLSPTLLEIKQRACAEDCVSAAAVLAESGHSHPEAAAEGRPHHHDQPLAAGEEDWQARER